MFSCLDSSPADSSRFLAASRIESLARVGGGGEKEEEGEEEEGGGVAVEEGAVLGEEAPWRAW